MAPLIPLVIGMIDPAPVVLLPTDGTQQSGYSARLLAITGAYTYSIIIMM